MTYYFGQEAEQLYREKAAPLTSSDLIQGIVANRGNVTSLSGKARILECNNAAQARELGQSFREGDILVTPMAQLNIWHIIKRASAIVTDEGGMLSHAAIVARESNIPCIVGTRTATFLIKDGDMITLDLTRGIVRVDD
jgi:phosphoenolpyruvate synthase/pyruvate phosphate dikinase